jgi:hypothetical protein
LPDRHPDEPNLKRKLNMATPRTTRDRARSPEAYTAGDGGGPRKRRGWLWGLLGLLALLAVLLIALLSGGNDENTGGAQPSPSADAAAPAQAGDGAAAGSLTARNESLLPVPSGGLGTYETEPATGRQVTVQSVVQDEGFWVGTSSRDRVYVEYGGDVGENEPQNAEPAVGDKVNLSGEMRPAPEHPGRTLRLADQDAQQVSRQGAYINADNVEIP